MNKRNVFFTIVLLSVFVLGLCTILYAGENNSSIPESIDLKVVKAELKEGGNWVTVNNILEIVQPSATFIRVELGVADLVADPVREFSEARLILGEGSTVKVGGTDYPLTAPSGLVSGLKVKTTFPIEANVIAIIFDVSESLSYNQGAGYTLEPVYKEAIIEQVDPNKPSFREANQTEAETIRLAEEYFKSSEALNATDRERMDTLISIPGISKVSCGDSGYNCVYWLSTGAMFEYIWGN